MSKSGFSGIGLYHPKDRHNVAATLRAAEAYGSAFVAYSGKRYRTSGVDANKSVRKLPLFQTDDLFDLIPYDCTPVAIEFLKDAKPLHTFEHPKRAFYIFGPEDSTLGEPVLSKCAHVVYVPTEICMNLAATVNVVLYDRMVKEIQRREKSEESFNRSLQRLENLNKQHKKTRTSSFSFFDLFRKP